MKRIITCIIAFCNYFTEYRIPRAAAALAYFLTMTFFPLIIVIYYWLGLKADSIIKVTEYLNTFLAHETVNTIESFLNYVSENHSPAMLIAGFLILMTSAASAVRNIQFTIGDIQGKMRFKQLSNYLTSFLISLFFIAVLYVGVFVLLSGRTVINSINSVLPMIDISRSWNYLRFVILLALLPITLYSVYWMCRDKTDKYSLWPGVIVSTVGTVGICIVFSVFMNASARYPLVYGSMASIILLMMWIYAFSTSMYSGALVNVMVRDIKKDRTF